MKPQIEIADSIGDDTVARITILKSARIGATQLMDGALGHFVENDPSPVLCVVPVDMVWSSRKQGEGRLQQLRKSGPLGMSRSIG